LTLHGQVYIYLPVLYGVLDIVVGKGFFTKKTPYNTVYAYLLLNSEGRTT